MSENEAIGVIGVGWVGLVTAACFAEIGHEVVAMDVDEDKVAALRRGAGADARAGLAELLERNRERLTFTTEIVRRARLGPSCSSAAWTRRRPTPATPTSRG